MNTLDATVFVYQSKRKPYKTKCVYIDDAPGYERNPGWKHTATLHPAKWIEHLMNNPKDRAEIIEGLTR